MMTPREYCQRLRAEITNGELVESDGLRTRILDFFIRNGPTPDKFEELLQARINDSDPAKEESRAICTEILEGWKTPEEQHTGNDNNDSSST